MGWRESVCPLRGGAARWERWGCASAHAPGLGAVFGGDVEVTSTAPAFVECKEPKCCSLASIIVGRRASPHPPSRPP